jgi:hypothetical protein
VLSPLNYTEPDSTVQLFYPAEQTCSLILLIQANFQRQKTQHVFHSTQFYIFQYEEALKDYDSNLFKKIYQKRNHEMETQEQQGVENTDICSCYGCVPKSTGNFFGL